MEGLKGYMALCQHCLPLNVFVPCRDRYLALVFATTLDAGPCTLQAGAGSSSTVLLEKCVSSIATLHCYPGTGI